MAKNVAIVVRREAAAHAQFAAGTTAEDPHLEVVDEIGNKAYVVDV